MPTETPSASPRIRPTVRGCAPGWPGQQHSPAIWKPRPSPSTGLVTDGSPQDTELLLARGNLAFFQGDLEAADTVASEARRRVALGRPDEWQMFELISLQGLVAHSRGEWFQRLRLELRSGARRPALAAGIFDSHLCVAEFLLYGPTPYPEVLELAASLRDTAERSGVLRALPSQPPCAVRPPC